MEYRKMKHQAGGTGLSMRQILARCALVWVMCAISSVALAQPQTSSADAQTEGVVADATAGATASDGAASAAEDAKTATADTNAQKEAPDTQNDASDESENVTDAEIVDTLGLGTAARNQATPAPRYNAEGELIVPDRDLTRGGALPAPGAADDDVATAYQKALATYQGEVQDLDTTIRQIVNAEYRSRRARISDYFESQVQVLRVKERALRSRAIDEFEAFVQRFPDDDEHTPDALFRLAELYYEQTEARFILRDLKYEDQFRKYDKGLIPSPPQAPEKDFSRSIALFERLVRQFPDYRQVDGAWYLLAICHLQMYQNDDALSAFETLVQNYPDSKFSQEAYLRIGEEYFSDQNFKLARPAYERAEFYGDSVWYDKILFKLGWSNYLLNQYDSAIKNFLTLLEYYANKKNRSQESVREEALQYTAITLAEQDWDLDGATDAGFALPRALKYLKADRAYTPEVLDRLAKILSKYAEGGGAMFYSTAEIEVLRYVIDEYPNDPKNPKRQDEIITALFRSNKIKQALAEGDRFIHNYEMGSDWYAAQEKAGNFEQIAYAERTSRSLLIEAGTILYNEAEALAADAVEKGDHELATSARKRYHAASVAFEHFLKNYPNDAQVYEARMFLAQSLFNGGDYLGAAQAFSGVRDSDLSTKYRDTAAVLAVNAYNKAILKRIHSGELGPRALPSYAGSHPDEVKKASGEESGELRSAPANEPIPDLSLDWVHAVDRRLALNIKNEDDPDVPGQLAFNAARLFYFYHHYESATKRFIEVIRNYCGQKETGFAASLLINTYRLQEDYANVEYWSNEVQRMGDCVQVPERLAKAFQEDLERFKMGAVADKAEKYYAQGEYKKAAEEYIHLTEKYSDSELAPLGLYNAGQIYEQDLRDYRSAMKEFEALIDRYPDSEYVDKALVRVAVNSKNAFDFEKAIQTYMELYKRGYSDPDIGLDSPLLTAADLMRFTQQYDRAADAYLTYARKHPRDGRAPAAVFRAASVYYKAGEYDKMRKTYARYRQRYGGQSNALIDGNLAVLTSYINERDVAQKEGESHTVESLNDTIVAQYKERRPKSVPPSWADVQSAVGKILYDRAKAKFERWDEKPLGTDAETQKRRIKERVDAMPKLRDEFNAVIVVGSADWTICAKYQEGMIYKRMSDRVAQMPPPDFPSIEVEDMYYGGTPDGSWPGVDKIVRQWEDQALKDWSEDGYPVAQRSGVYNTCARSMLAELHRVHPDKYPVYRTEVRAHGSTAFTASSIMTPPARMEQGAASLGERPVEDEKKNKIDINFDEDSGK